LSYRGKPKGGHGVSRHGFSRKFAKTNSLEDGSYSAKELHQKFLKSGGSDLFEAKDVGDYWTIIFKPDGRYMGRYSRNDAIQKADEKNTAFLTTSPFVGLEIASYNTDGKLARKNKVIAVDMTPEGLISGAVVALLDDGSQVTRDIAYFDKKLNEQKN
jgi:hypothetical protein